MMARLAAARHARLATIRPGGRPHIVPITFAIDDGRLVTAIDQKPKRTMEVQRLQNIRGNPAVSVLVDHYDDDWRQLWWVRADGVATIVEEGDGHVRAVTALQGKYPAYVQDPPTGAAIIVAIHDVVGWTAQDDDDVRPGSSGHVTPR